MTPDEAAARLADLHHDFSKMTGSDKKVDLTPVAVADPGPEKGAVADWSDRLRTALLIDEAEGWARFQSRVLWTGMPEAPDAATAGLPIRAEWCEGGDVSRLFALDPDAPGCALIYRFEDRPIDLSAPDLVAGETCWLRETRRSLANAKAQGVKRLSHYVYWGFDDGEDGALRCVFSRFAGFER